MLRRSLTALPVYNEVDYVQPVLDGATAYSRDVLVVDDGSRDGTADVLARYGGIHVVTHPHNRGYGAAVRSAMAYAAEHDYDVLVTIDCDGQHQPRMIPQFIEAADRADVVSGSRYLRAFAGDTIPPEERRQINQQITDELNSRLGLQLTDAFCGFKAYRVAALRGLTLTEDGYAMPLEFWAQAAARGLEIIELPVPLIYLDQERSFGGSLDDGRRRLQVYRDVLDRAIARASLPARSAPVGWAERSEPHWRNAEV
jgi:dolichol-phosphate mannosyltransferase